MPEINKPGAHLLTRREQEIIALSSTGLIHKEVAQQLYVSPETVKKHLSNIYIKLGVNNKIEAINKLRDHFPSPVF
jgi:NarL family two-component system response regulator LiaR